MKLLLILFTLSILSCSSAKKNEEVSKTSSKEITVDKFNTLLDTHKLTGTILIYEVQKETYYTNDHSTSKTGAIPASTFKIPNSIIGLETGNLADETTVFKWDGRKRAYPMWEKDLTLKEAFQVSCVPCYQELARSIGVDTMQSYLDKLGYGGMDVNQDNLDMFWLAGDSRISPMEQIKFLRRLYKGELPISTTTTETLKNIMKMETNKVYSLSGKTGWAVIGEENIGWFVGYLENQNGMYYFATRITPKTDLDTDNFIKARKQITLDAFKKLGII